MAHSKKLLLMSIVFFVLSLIPLNSHAQSGELEGFGQLRGAGTVSVEITPEFPIPNAATSVKLITYNTNLDKARISWTIGGKAIKSGVGEKTLTFTTGPLGKTSLVMATIYTKEGYVMIKEIPITPLEVNFLWEAMTYVPPFYKGKAGYGYGSVARVIAFPEFFKAGTRISNSNLVYKWSINGRVAQDASGYGKNFLDVPEQIFPKSIAVEVEVKSFDGTLAVKKEVVLEPVQPKVLVYENNPLYGILAQKSLANNYTLVGNEITISAIPYFFSATERTGSDMQYRWSLNNRDLGLQDNADITLRSETGKGGGSRVSLEVKNAATALQYTNNDFSVSYK